VTETDVAVAMRKFREIVEDRYQDHRIRNLIIKDIMKTPVITIGKDATIDEAAGLMISKGISCIPVMNGDKILGVVTRSSLVRAL